MTTAAALEAAAVIAAECGDRTAAARIMRAAIAAVSTPDR